MVNKPPETKATKVARRSLWFSGFALIFALGNVIFNLIRVLT